jgi:hypothetical protein
VNHKHFRIVVSGHDVPHDCHAVLAVMSAITWTLDVHWVEGLRVQLLHRPAIQHRTIKTRAPKRQR